MGRDYQIALWEVFFFFLSLDPHKHLHVKMSRFIIQFFNWSVAGWDS